MIKGSKQHEDSIHKYLTLKRRAPTYIKPIITGQKGDINSHAIIVKDFSTPFLTIDKSSREIRKHWI